MKNMLIIFCVVFATCLLVSFANFEQAENDKYLRIHIRATSNDEADQNVKYVIRDEIINYLAPLLATTSSKKSAMDMVGQNLDELKCIADNILSQNNLNYQSKVYLSRETFPERKYEDYTLERGIYDALIVELGEGEGQNWWCVVYPPLCFVSYQDTDENFQYRSLLRQLIDDFFTS